MNEQTSIGMLEYYVTVSWEGSRCVAINLSREGIQNEWKNLYGNLDLGQSHGRFFLLQLSGFVPLDPLGSDSYYASYKLLIQLITFLI